MVTIQLLVIIPIVALVATGAIVVFAFPNLLLPNRLEVDDDTTTQDLLESYSILIKGIVSGEDFTKLTIPEREQVIDMVNELNDELETDIEMTDIDPDEDLPFNEDALSKPCVGDCQTSPEVVNPCAGAGFVFDDNLGCISEPIAEIIEDIELTFDPTSIATEFDVFTTITLIDSSNEEFIDEGKFNVPLTSLITRSGSILDLAKIKVRLTGASDSINPIKATGTLNYKINGEAIRGIPLVTTAVPNQITSAFEIKINNRLEDTFSFDTIPASKLMTGSFANTLDVTMRNFKIEQGNSTFNEPTEIVLYSLDFTNNQGLKTVIGSTGKAVGVPIADGVIEFCAKVRNFNGGSSVKIVGGETTSTPIVYTFIPDKPKFITVRQDTGMKDEVTNEIVYETIVPAFTVNLGNVGINFGQKDFCEERNGIPRTSDIEVVVSGKMDFGTGSGNEIETPDQIFKIKTPETMKKYLLQCTSGDVDFVVHWCNSDFNYGYGRDSTEFIVSP